ACSTWTGGNDFPFTGSFGWSVIEMNKVVTVPFMVVQCRVNQLKPELSCDTSMEDAKAIIISVAIMENRLIDRVNRLGRMDGREWGSRKLSCSKASVRVNSGSGETSSSFLIASPMRWS